MKVGRPKVVADVRALGLTEEEGFVASRIDGNLSVGDIAALTGMETARVEAIVHKLERRGAVRVEAADGSGRLPDDGASPWARGQTSLSEFAAAFGLEGAEPSEPALPEPAESSLQLHDAGDASDPYGGLEPVDDDPYGGLEPVDEGVEAKSDAPAPAVARGSRPDLDGARASRPDATEAEQDDVSDIGDDDATDQAEDAPRRSNAPEPTEEEQKLNERNYREIYATKFHGMTADARIAAAKTASGSDLIALCFDADPRVIHAVLENHTSGLEHARWIAQQHRTKTGIEMVSRRSEFLRDALVERRLLRNPQCGDVTIGRILSPKRIGATYKIAIDRDIPELTRIKSRAALRKKWQSSPPEDRAELVLRTDGRCLTLLIGCAFDAKSTQLICAKQVVSVLLVTNFCKFPATPPAILAHLIKQPFVRKNPGLRKMLLQHPNMPGEVKRQFV